MEGLVKLNLAEINPDSLRSLPTPDLVNTHRRLHMWFANDPGDEEILNRHLLVMQEMKRRNLRHRTEDLDALDRQSYKLAPNLLEFFRGRQGRPVQKISELRPEIQKLIYGLQDFVLIPNYVCLTGSALYPEVVPEREPNDIDVLVRQNFADPKLELKLARQFKQLVDYPLHMVYDAQGPSFTYCAVYDLVLKKKENPKLEVLDTFEFRRSFYKSGLPHPMKEAPVDIIEKLKTEFEVLKPFRPYDVEGEFYSGQEDEIFDWAEGKFPIIVQEKFDGMRFTVHKKDDTVKIYTEDRLRDRADIFPTIVGELKKIPHDFIIDTEFEEHVDGKPSPRTEMMWMIVGTEPTEREKNVVVNIHDLVFVDGEDISDLGYEDRLKRLNDLGFKSERLRVAESVKAQTGAELLRAIEKMSKKPGSEGAMLKAADFKYVAEGVARGVAKFKKVIEIDVAVIGWRRLPKARPEGEHWTKEEAKRRLPELLEQSDTFLLRVAAAGPRGLVPIESKSKVTPGDLDMRWNEEKQTWEGAEDPEQWHMCPHWDHRKTGEYKYASTYAVKLDTPPKCGMIVTVAPTKIDVFEKEGGTSGISWEFPRVVTVKTEGSPGTIRNILAAFGFSPEEFRFAKAQDDESFEPEEALTHTEMRRLEELQFGDPYMIRQGAPKDGRPTTYPFEVQYHVRGIFTEEARSDFLDSLEKAKDPETIKRLFDDFEIKEVVGSYDEFSRKLSEEQRKGKEGKVEAVIEQFIKDPDPESFEKQRLVQVGNVHTDLRLKSPHGNYLIGWTLDTPGVALQFMSSGELKFPGADKFLDNQGENILTQRKSVQPLAWLTVVSPSDPEVEFEPREVAATPETAGRLIFKASGEYVAGVQKSDYHEYFLFFDQPEFKKLNGRWGVQLISGSFTQIGRFAWIMNRPEEQRPYILTHDFEKEAEKAKAERIKMFWNEETVENLRKLEYNSIEKDAEPFDPKDFGKLETFLWAERIDLEKFKPETLKVFPLEGVEDAYEVIGELREPVPDPDDPGQMMRKGTVGYAFRKPKWSVEKVKEFLKNAGLDLRVKGGPLTMKVEEAVQKVLDKVKQQMLPPQVIVGQVYCSCVEKESPEFQRQFVEELVKAGVTVPSWLGEKLEVQKSVFCPIVKINYEERIVTGVVLEPNKEDAQGDIISEEDIRKAMFKYMEDYRVLGFMHREFGRNFALIENYQAPQDLEFGSEKVSKGTWLMTVKVNDDDVWAQVKRGEITGFSIQGMGKRIPLGR